MPAFPLFAPVPGLLLPYEPQLWRVQMQFQAQAGSLKSDAARKLAVDNAVAQNFAGASPDVREAARQYLTVLLNNTPATQSPVQNRLQIMKATQAKIFEITQDVTVNKAKTADKAFNAMDGYIRG
ncbi:MAG TPA: hypothetical protein VG796_27470 [Verrucomicrobiales bacterium]|nr:hypothetical protein [Verrucomicrobiales bacterium]